MQRDDGNNLTRVTIVSCSLVAMWIVHVWSGRPFWNILESLLIPANIYLLNWGLQCVLAARRQSDRVLELSLAGNALLLLALSATLHVMDRSAHAAISGLFEHATDGATALLAAAGIVWALRLATERRLKRSLSTVQGATTAGSASQQAAGAVAAHQPSTASVVEPPPLAGSAAGTVPTEVVTVGGRP